MRRALWGIAALIIIGVVAILIAPLFISAENVRNTLFDQVESATGYRIRVAGNLDISVFPSLDLVAGEVSVSQRIGEQYQDVAVADELRFGLALSSLLSGKVRMTEIALVGPVITVPQAESRESTAGSDTSGGSDSPAEALRSLSLDRLSIEDGTVQLADGRQVSALDLTASLADFDAPLTLDLKAVFDGNPISLAGEIGRFGPFLQGEVAPVAISVGYPSALASDLSVSGRALYTGDAFALEPFEARAGDSAFGGEIRVDMSQPVTRIRASLNGEVLDLDSLLATGGASEGQAAAPSSDTSDQPIDFSALETTVADVDVSVSKVVVSGIAITPLVANLHVGEGKANLVADLIGVGSASGMASLALNATRESPYVSGKLRITGVDLGEASRLAGESAVPVSGTAGADIVFATAGRTPAELKARINASGSLSLQNGSATVAALSGATGKQGTERITDINATAKFEDLIKPVSVAGSAAWNGERFDLSATADVRGILAGQSSGVQAQARSQRVSAGFNGKVSAAGAADGRVSLETASLTGLMRWLGQKPAWQSGFEAFSVDGRLAVSETAIAFEDTRIRLDDTEGTGSGKVTLGAKPSVTAKLDLETLNVNPYLGEAGREPAGQPAAGGPAGWSTDRIDFSALNALDADLALSVKRLVYKRIKTGPVAISAKISGGKLDAQLSNLKLYKGAGTGTLQVDASGQTPTQGFKFSLSGLDAFPFLRDAAGFSRIEGTAAIAVDLTARGQSQREIVSALNGTASFEFKNGAVRGINVAKMARNLTSGVLSGWGSGEAEKTDFASLGASFAVAGGKARTDDLHLYGPLVRVSGAGTVDMPAQTLDLKVDPKVVASLEGQGGQADLEGLGVPVVVAGPWASPKIYPDIAGILQNPQAAYQQLQKLGGGLFNLPGAGALGGGALGGKDDALGGVADKIKEETGVDIGDILKDGKIDEDALKGGALKGLEQLLGGGSGGQATGGQPAAKPAAKPQAQPKGKAEGKQQQPKAKDGPKAKDAPKAGPEPGPKAQEKKGGKKAKTDAAAKETADEPAKETDGDAKTRRKKKNADQADQTEEMDPEEAAKQLLQDLLKKE